MKKRNNERDRLHTGQRGIKSKLFLISDTAELILDFVLNSIYEVDSSFVFGLQSRASAIFLQHEK